MDSYTLDHDIKLWCVQASSFPDGIMAAHDKIHTIFPVDGKRQYYGISWAGGPNGEIIYKAAAEALEGDAMSNGLETFTMKKGEYYSEMIHDFMNNTPAIGQTFQGMIHKPDIDPEGACIEWYINDKDLQCMVRKA